MAWCHHCNISLMIQGPVSLTFIHHNLDSMEISFHTHLNSYIVISTTFCTCRDVLKFVAIWWLATELQPGKVSIEFELQAKNRLWNGPQGAVSIRKTVLLGMVIPMLKIRRPTGRLIFNMGIPLPGKTVFYIETGPRPLAISWGNHGGDENISKCFHNKWCIKRNILINNG